MRKNNGKLNSVTWQQGEDLLVHSLADIIRQGRGERIVFVNELITGSLKGLIDQWLSEMGSKGHLCYESFAYEPLRQANRLVFHYDGLPHYCIDQADFLISFGAGFLETWISNLEFARQFASFHALKPQGKNPFIYVGPRLSLTANNADQWIAVPPGEEYLIGLGMLRVLLDEGSINYFSADLKAWLRKTLQDFTLERIHQKTGVQVTVIRDLAHRFSRAKKPLALAEGLGLSGPHAIDAAVAANLLCLIKPGSFDAIDLLSPSTFDHATPLNMFKELSERMKRKEIDLLLLGQVNPVFNLPFSEEFRQGLNAVPMVISFSCYPDETSTLASLVLPNHTFLESWGDYSPREGVSGLLQPVMGPVFKTRHLGDILISTGKKVMGPDRFPWKDYYQFLREYWIQKGKEIEPGQNPEEFWQKALEQGGIWKDSKKAKVALPSRHVSYSFSKIEETVKADQMMEVTVYPTIQFFDGRGANRPWIQELPDPMTQMTWDGWIEIHPETAKALEVQEGDILLLRSPYGSLEGPAYPVYTVPPKLLALPVGQGHWKYGRYADGHPANPLTLFSPTVDQNSGGMFRPAFKVTVQKLNKQIPMAHTDGSFFQHDRDLMQTMTLAGYQNALNSGQTPSIDLPYAAGYDPKKDFYPPHQHREYRWGMVVDLDRCIGCSACVVACYAENNVAVVEKTQVLKGREMSWIRIQRYFDPNKGVARWLPMLCQHCDYAPCESVCPVYAPFHNPEGLNTQVYNRCMGTRFCLQNDPYKVRRFNWFTYTHPNPLNWQLNPDVTVRQKGVMEKCSFCIQRIIETKIRARKEGRKVKDGEFTTACAQTCPTDTLTFGNLLDANSRISRMIKDTRRYQVLGYLNTKPAVIYLKKVDQPIEI
jgi:molybdopterin-containing oxidoreductase family iron-sulfur binding subunit